MMRTATWKLPTTYSDGTVIPPGNVARIVTHLYMDGVEIGVSTMGAATWSGEIAMVMGQTYNFTAACTLDGQTSLPSPEVAFTVPFVHTNPPTSLIIS